MSFRFCRCDVTIAATGHSLSGLPTYSGGRRPICSVRQDSRRSLSWFLWWSRSYKGQSRPVPPRKKPMGCLRETMRFLTQDLYRWRGIPAPPLLLYKCLPQVWASTFPSWKTKVSRKREEPERILAWSLWLYRLLCIIWLCDYICTPLPRPRK